MPASFSSWGSPIGAFVWSAPVAAITFANLSPYRELLLQILSVTHNSGTPNLELLISTDNGATFKGLGDYGRAGASAGTSSIVLASTAAVTPAAYSATVEAFNWNQPAQTLFSLNGGRDNSGTGSQSALGFQVAAEALNALRVQWSTGTDILAGSVFLYGKSP